MIIGLVGRMASGKGEVVRILQDMGFSHIALSDFVREEAAKRGMPGKRANLMGVGNLMRAKEGASVLAHRALERIRNAAAGAKNTDIAGGASAANAGISSVDAVAASTGLAAGNWVIDGIRNPAEINELKCGRRQGEKIYLVGIDARQDLLVARILSRKRTGDVLSRDEIIKKLEQEWGKGEPEDGQQVGKCMKKVDFVIKNEGTVDELKQNFLSYFNSIKDAV